jgi:ISXO2-like transposase domain/Transposase zinc-ribbon domain
MGMNRVQFQKGLSLAEFIERYGSEEACEQALFNSRWPQGWCCPRCGCDLSCCFYRDARKYWKCYLCGHQTTLVSGTLFAATKLALSKWFLALYLLTQTKNSVSALELMRHLGVCYRTAWRVKHKLMQAMAERESTRQLSGRVEVDDAYLGGERSGGKAGRGSENKVPFVAAVQTTPSGQPQVMRLDPVTGFTKEAIGAWARQALTASAVVVSDALNCFPAVSTSGAAHQPHRVGSGKQAVDHPQFHWVNTILGNLKTSIAGTYHAFAFRKYAHRYLAEVQYRFNRRFKLKDMLARLLRAAVLTAPYSEPRLRLAPAGTC